MDHLRGLARTDGDHLRQVELEAGRMSEDAAHGLEHQRVHDEIAAGGGTRHEATGPSRPVTHEVVGPDRRRVEVGPELRTCLIEKGGRYEAFDDGAALATERIGDLLTAGSGGETGNRHRCRVLRGVRRVKAFRPRGVETLAGWA
jgi:hypothetical protein